MWSLGQGLRGSLWGWRDNILEIQEPLPLLSCPLQLLEMSFNCLEDVESTIPVSPLHLAVSLQSFPPVFFVPPCPRPTHRHEHLGICPSFCLLVGMWQAGSGLGRAGHGTNRESEGPKLVAGTAAWSFPMGPKSRVGTVSRAVSIGYPHPPTAPPRPTTVTVKP